MTRVRTAEKMSSLCLMRSKERLLAVYVFLVAAILTFTFDNLLGLKGMLMGWETYGPALITVAVLAWCAGPEMSDWIRKGDLYWRGAGGGALFTLAAYAVAAFLMVLLSEGLGSVWGVLVMTAVVFLMASIALGYGIILGALAGIVYGRLVAGGTSD